MGKLLFCVWPPSFAAWYWAAQKCSLSLLGETLGHVAHFFFSICNHTCPLPHRLVSTETGKCSQKPLRGDVVGVVGARLRAVVESNSWSLFSVGWCGAASCRLEAARWTGRPWKVGPEGSTGLSSSPAPFQGPPSPCLSHLLLSTIMVLVVKLVIRNAISPIVPSCPPFPARVTPYLKIARSTSLVVS